MWDTDLGISTTTANTIITAAGETRWEGDGAVPLGQSKEPQSRHRTTQGHEQSDLGKHLVRSDWGGSVVTPWGKARRPMWLMSQESAGWWTGQGTQTWKAQDGTWPCRPSEVSSVVSNSLQPHGLDSPWHSPGQNTGMGGLSLHHGIFPTLGSNPGFSHHRCILYQLSHKGSPRILEWVAYPFSSGSSRPRNWTGVFCIAGRFFTNWAIREALPTK